MTDVVLMAMLMLMPAAAFGIERRRFAGDAWMTVVGGAPMMSNVPVRIAVIEAAVDASWQTGDLNDLSASRGAQMINVATKCRTNVVMTVAAVAAATIGIFLRVTNAVTGVRRFNGSVRVSHSGIVPSTNRKARLLQPPPQRMIWFGGAMQRLQPWKPDDRSIASGALRRCEVPPSFCNCFAMPKPPACWWRRSPGLDWDRSPEDRCIRALRCRRQLQRRLIWRL